MRSCPQGIIYLEVECLITVEDQHKSSQLIAESLHGLCFSCPSRTWKLYVNITVWDNTAFTALTGMV